MRKFYEYTIKQGDSLQMIAQTLLGDAGRAFDIALLNDLEYPFIGEIGHTSDKNIRTQGDVILIPLGATDEDIYDMHADPDIAIFGSDFIMSSADSSIDSMSIYQGGDLVTNQYGDTQTIKGVQVLKQDLIHRLITDIGTLPYHPDFGSRFLYIIGNKNNPNWRDKAGVELSRCFMSDVRVDEVRDITIEPKGVGVSIGCTIVTSKTEFTLSEDIKREGV